MKTLRFIIILGAITLALGLGWYILHTKKILAKPPSDGSANITQPASRFSCANCLANLPSQITSDG